MSADAEVPEPAWLVTAVEECRELWVGVGRGPGLMLAFAALLSAVTYLAGTNHALNYLEQRESVQWAGARAPVCRARTTASRAVRTPSLPQMQRM